VARRVERSRGTGTRLGRDDVARRVERSRGTGTRLGRDDVALEGWARMFPPVKPRAHRPIGVARVSIVSARAAHG
jgi:hypothetical protein